MEKLERINSIDTLRGLSVIFYLMFHFASWWTSASGLWLFGYWEHEILLAPIPYLGMVAAPIFIMVSGMSQRIALESRRMQNFPETEIRIHAIKRGLILLIFHFFLHFLYFYWEPGKNVWWWDEIATIAASGIIIYFTSKISVKWRLILIGLMIYFYPALRIILHMEQDYFLLIYNAPWSVDRFLAGMISNGTCPLIPQASMAILGSILAEYLINIKNKENQSKVLIKLTIFFVLLILISTIIRYIPYFSTWDLGFHLIQSFGIWGLIFIVIYWIQDINRVPPLRVFTFLSSLSLTLFYIHVVFGYAVIFLSGGVQKLSAYSFYIILISFILIIFNVSIFWSKIKFKGSLEFILRRLS
ncbi:MAG: heparan-alpha-glucosaminide N-acetyltransferase domain-containing protein [Promethearchaeota archaeon]